VSTKLELADSRAETAALANLVASVADNKYFLAHRLARWGVGAPALESAVACTAIAQEEAGHARGLYSLLEDFPPELRPVPLDREDDRERKYAVSFLVEESDSWYRAVAAQALMDFAMTTLLEACVGSSVTELRKRADRILADEGFHRRYVEGRLRELGSTPAEGSILEDELAALLPETLCWFGPPGEPGLELLVGAGIVEHDNETLRERFLVGMHAQTGVAGLSLPDTRKLPWERWSGLERRLSSEPAPGDDVACPWCSSVEVERLGEFGPGLMTEQWMCLSCKSPFERIRKR
jgi:1,2-phenylacetyl-CoA epoxidase catalytic subunit